MLANEQPLGGYISASIPVTWTPQSAGRPILFIGFVAQPQNFSIDLGKKKFAVNFVTVFELEIDILRTIRLKIILQDRVITESLEARW